MPSPNRSTHVRTRAPRRLFESLVAFSLVWVLSGCFATPIPDPPSLDVTRMSLRAAGDGMVRLAGAAGAVRPGSRALRVTNVTDPSTPSRATVLAAADGSFGVSLLGATIDTLYVEGIGVTDDFELAVRREGGRVVAADPGGDRDMDGSPDAIDCAPDDPMLVGGRCGLATCATGMDCAAGQECVDGVCIASMCMRAEVCGNGLDDDCDGLTDGGCSAPCMSSLDCVAGESCVMNVCTATACMLDGDCGAMERCAMGICVASSCATDGECAIGEECLAGACVPAACMTDADCSAELVCQANVCAAPSCMTDGDCAPSYRCTMGTCVLATCASEADCAMGQACVMGLCR